MKAGKIIGFLFFVFVSLFAVYYVFIDTLSFSQLIGKTQSPKATIFINLFDFDTGLTRYDIYQINKRSDYWERRIREVQSIQDARAREKANEELMAEMMEDPSLKKVIRKFLGLGARSAGALMQILGSIIAQR